MANENYALGAYCALSVCNLSVFVLMHTLSAPQHEQTEEQLYGVNTEWLVRRGIWLVLTGLEPCSLWLLPRVPLPQLGVEGRWGRIVNRLWFL